MKTDIASSECIDCVINLILLFCVCVCVFGCLFFVFISSSPQLLDNMANPHLWSTSHRFNVSLLHTGWEIILN